MQYDEGPRWIVVISLLTILGFAFAYPFAGGVHDAGDRYRFTTVTELASATGAGDAVINRLIDHSVGPA